VALAAGAAALAPSPSLLGPLWLAVALFAPPLSLLFAPNGVALVAVPPGFRPQKLATMAGLFLGAWAAALALAAWRGPFG